MTNPAEEPMRAYIDPKDYPCFIDSQRVKPRGIKCIGADKCNNKGCPLVQDRRKEHEDE